MYKGLLQGLQLHSYLPVVVAGRYESVSFQIKYISGCFASTFGNCYPFYMLFSNQIAIFILMFMMVTKRDYCNVLPASTPAPPFSYRGSL